MFFLAYIAELPIGNPERGDVKENCDSGKEHLRPRSP